MHSAGSVVLVVVVVVRMIHNSYGVLAAALTFICGPAAAASKRTRCVPLSR